MIVVGRPRRFAFAALLFTLIACSRLEAAPSSLPRVEANDNRRPAGRVDAGVLRLALRAAMGRWQPEGPDGPALAVEALGEVDAALTVPAPLVRVTEGTTIAISIRNELSAPLTVHGLCTRGGASCPAFQIPPAATREVRFSSGPAGTYHYWASSLGAPVPFREMAGAFVVDPATGAQPDRILVVTEWSDLTPRQLFDIVTADDQTATFVRFNPRLTFVINGLSWPATERFTYERGETVRWRVINVSSQAHPLHLHGFYFDVNSVGDGLRDGPIPESQPRRVVTQLLASGGTMTMTWVPEREGNWLFHCHIMHHVSPERRIGRTEPSASPGAAHHHSHDAHDASLGMAGMVIGVTVREPSAPHVPSSDVATVTPRKLTLTLRPAPGPAIVLTRNEPVEITVVNDLAEATAVHWHGIELESFYDGVHGFSGAGPHVTPMIEPHQQFVVRFTPPRAGTFIDHTHLHDYRQLSSGLYGPIVVTEQAETFDSALDHVVVIGRSGLTTSAPSLLSEPESVVINGERSPRFVWKSGTRHRVRVINITPDDIFNVSLQTAAGPALWKPVAKDGTPFPSATAPITARQVIAVGETYDFEYEAPAGRSTAWFEVRTTGGKWQAQGQVLTQ